MKIFYSLSTFLFLFFIQLRAASNWEWARQAGRQDLTSGQSIALDPSGNIFVAGHFLSPDMTLGGTTLQSSGNYGSIFIAKYDPNGNMLWTRTLIGDSTYSSAVVKIQCDANGDFYVTGMYNNSLTLDNITLDNIPISYQNIYLAKFNSNGQVIWAKKVGVGFITLWASTIDTYGNFYLTGGYQSDTAMFGPYVIYNHEQNGSTDVFTVKCNPSGDVLWVKNSGGSFSEYPQDIIVDANGTIITTGVYRSSSMDFGTLTIQNTMSDSTEEIFVSRMDTSGNFIWALSAGSDQGDNAIDAEFDSNGQIYITGNFQGDSTFFGNHFVIGNGSCNNTYLARIDLNGNFTWAMSYGSQNNNQLATGVRFDPNGDFYLGGYFAYAINIQGSILFGYGFLDSYIAKFNAAGNLLDYKIAGGRKSEILSDFINDSHGNIYVTGYSLSDTCYFGNQEIFHDSISTHNYNFYLAKIKNISVTGIESVSSNQVSIYPNPSNGKLFFKTGLQVELAVEVFTVSGTKILSNQYTGHTNSDCFLDLSNFNKGIYFVRVYGKESTSVSKIVIE